MATNHAEYLNIPTRAHFDLLCETSHDIVNHITIEVDTLRYRLATELCMMQMLRFSGPESKTVIRKQKLDRDKSYDAFYIGGKTLGHFAIIRYAIEHSLIDVLASRASTYDAYCRVMESGHGYKLPVGFLKRRAAITSMSMTNISDQQLVRYIALLY